jgi:hypothetical protein
MSHQPRSNEGRPSRLSSALPVVAGGLLFANCAWLMTTVFS